MVLFWFRLLGYYFLRLPKEIIFLLLRDSVEFFKILRWYVLKKLRFWAVTFEEAKGILVDILMARRGAHSATFLRLGLVGLALVAVFFTPIIVSHYPRAVESVSSEQLPPSAVLKTQTALEDVSLETQESQKPRRDIVEHTVAEDETVSTIAKNYGVDVDSVNYLNKITSSKILHPGDKLKIPPVSGVVITVQSGDTIFALAKKYGLPHPQPIADWPYNTFVSDEKFTLAAGQVLVIPGGVAPPEVPKVRPRLAPEVTIFAGGTGLFAWPTSGSITQYFAFYHAGIDIANNGRPAIAAADSGRVVSAVYEKYGYGYHVIIDHGNGYKTLYAHLSQIEVEPGQNISRGQVLGVMGSTGRSTGIHLHFSVYENDRPVNPLGHLK